MQQSTFFALKNIAKEHYEKLLFTFSLVLLENILFMLYPLFAGFAINAIIQGQTLLALSYAFMVLVFWSVGALRRKIDTLVFARIYAKIAREVALKQKEQNSSHSQIAARVTLSREFVDFFEIHFPMFFTSFISIIGAVIMLLVIDPSVGVASFCLLVVLMIFTPKFVKKNDILYFRLNNRIEKEVAVLKDIKDTRLNRHYDILARFRIALSNREAFAYLIVGISAAVLFSVAIFILSNEVGVSAGHIYSVMTYAWTFAISLDDAPRLMEQFSKLKDVAKRVKTQ